jgi:hypothetical protein
MNKPKARKSLPLPPEVIRLLRCPEPPMFVVEHGEDVVDDDDTFDEYGIDFGLIEFHDLENESEVSFSLSNFKINHGCCKRGVLMNYQSNFNMF